ncbi:hypothetical protein SAMN05446037_10083 [Anaerovirgula multivorans]|uniref:Uncharacterized protein n=1 Tax=Anaerovirgula multivorans TaxID=312168 RepID=A0A239DKG6_9FIRM|nr:hypothetical protein [Anaerovirgula multivorans]SNS32699.1 hypothetical protein SAMN05446037_10083 [Anaerovirgula multivorans]
MKITKRPLRILFIIIIGVFFIDNAVISYGVNQESTPKVVMVIINRVDFYDLYNMPQMKSIIDQSSIALMNTRASGRNSEFKSYATLGWGTRAEAAQNTSTFFRLEEETTGIYERRTGDLFEEEGIVNININLLIQQNLRGEYGAFPGILGDLLRKHNYRTAIIGNSDIENEKSRAIGLIAMDSRGYIDDGNVSEELIEEDNYSPYGIKTNYSQLLNSSIEVYPKGDLILIETGDTNRLDRYKDNLSTSLYQHHKNNILSNIDDFVGNLLNHIDINETLLMFVTPYPSDYAAAAGERLTPVIIYDGGLNQGLLWSSTTRRPGIIGNVDIAPTILSYFHIEPTNMIGRKLTSIPREDAINHIHYLNKRVVNTSLQRYRILYSFAIFQMLASVIALLAIVFKKRIHKKWNTPISLVLLSTIVAPFTLLILPLLGIMSLLANYLLLIGITGGFVCSLYALGRKNSLNMIMYASFLIMIGLIVDIILGQNLIKNSILGYDPIIGARYYGIGNEYMGVLIGSALIFTTTLIERFKLNKYFIILIYIFTIAIIALPTLGANVGGTITAVVAFLFTSIRLLGMKINSKKLIYIFLSMVMVIAVIAFIDLFIMENQTHLANALQQIVEKGPVAIYEIIARKISMNIRVMGVTVWSRVLLIALAILGVLFYRPVGVIKSLANDYPNIAIGWSGIILGCVISFAVNDSGVVAAATTIIFLTTSILYLIMNKTTLE